MTLTFNPDTYGSLLAQYRPKIIVSEIESDAAIAMAEDLEHRSSRTPEEEILSELLVALIGVIGSRRVTSEVVNGKRSISKNQAKALAEFFKVDAGLFI